MVVCVEAGLGLDQAMRKVADELLRAHPLIASEFNICNQHLQMGKRRETVLRELGDRNGVDDLKTLSSIMIQVDKFGTSIGTALRTQSDAMRVRRRQIAEEKAAKTAVKLIFPLVSFWVRRGRRLMMEKFLKATKGAKADSAAPKRRKKSKKRKRKKKQCF